MPRKSKYSTEEERKQAKREYARQYRIDKKEEISAIRKAKREANKEEFNRKQREYKARKRAEAKALEQSTRSPQEVK